MGKLERDFQANLIKELQELFPGCIVLKTDPSYIQGFPDLLILWGHRWAALECKRRWDAPCQPNQPYYISLLNSYSFAAVIYPENKGEVLYALQQAFEFGGKTRIPLTLQLPLG